MRDWFRATRILFASRSLARVRLFAASAYPPAPIGRQLEQRSLNCHVPPRRVIKASYARVADFPAERARLTAAMATLASSSGPFRIPRGLQLLIVRR